MGSPLSHRRLRVRFLVPALALGLVVWSWVPLWAGALPGAAPAVVLTTGSVAPVSSPASGVTQVAVASTPGDDTQNWKSFETAVKLLSDSETGRKLLARVEKSFNLSLSSTPPPTPEQLDVLFKWDFVSRTDAVLTRHFDPKSGLEERNREVSVHLKRDQPLVDLVYDLAHELTHAVAGPNWDPYDPGLTASGYIWTALEGPGGEVDAVVSECRVARELAGGDLVGRCLRYVRNAKIDREKVREDFYRIGDWVTTLRKRLGSEAVKFPLLSELPPRLYSSTGSAPYPVSLLREYDEITAVACDNSRRRYAAASRGPASESDQAWESTREFLQNRCKRTR